MTAPFPLRNAGLAGPIAVAPLVGAEPGEESHWLGALVSELLTAHLAAGGLSVVPYNITAQAILDRKIALPLEAQRLFPFFAKEREESPSSTGHSAP